MNKTRTPVVPGGPVTLTEIFLSELLRDQETEEEFERACRVQVPPDGSVTLHVLFTAPPGNNVVVTATTPLVADG